MTTIPKLNDLTGQTFSRLTVIERDTARKGVYWLCRCECGKIVSVRACHLMSGRTKSCGCLNPPKNQKECVVCGALFYAPPSSKKVTCGDECRRVRKVWIYLHGKRPESVKKAISDAKKGKRPPTYDMFLAANKASEKTQRTEMNSAAKLWRIRNIDSGEEYEFVSLSNFLRTHSELFDVDAADDAAVHRVCAGFHAIKHNLKAGKSCITYKGWQIIDFDDRANWQVGYERSFEMKKIIKNKVYDTDTAQKCGEWDNGYYTSDFYFCGETLYRKKTGEFFLHGEGHALSKYAGHSGNSSGWGEQITPMSYAEAQAWAEEHLDGDDYITIFGEPDEDDSSVAALNIRISAAKMQKLRQAAGKRGVSLVELVESMIDAL